MPSWYNSLIEVVQKTKDRWGKASKYEWCDVYIRVYAMEKWKPLQPSQLLRSFQNRNNYASPNIWWLVGHRKWLSTIITRMIVTWDFGPGRPDAPLRKSGCGWRILELQTSRSCENGAKPVKVLAPRKTRVQDTRHWVVTIREVGCESLHSPSRVMVLCLQG
jgi:hypothetical protein